MNDLEIFDTFEDGDLADEALDRTTGRLLVCAGTLNVCVKG